MTIEKTGEATTKKNRKLASAMLPKIAQVYDLFDPITVDVEFIKTYEKLIPQNGALDVNNLVELGSQFLYASDQCKDAAVVASALAAVGKARVEKEYALARLNRAPDYFLKVGNAKPTDKDREAYCDQDDAYQKELSKSNQWKAIAEYFEKTRMSFENWHNWAKKLYDVDNQSKANAQKPRG